MIRRRKKKEYHKFDQDLLLQYVPFPTNRVALSTSLAWFIVCIFVYFSHTTPHSTHRSWYCNHVDCSLVPDFFLGKWQNASVLNKYL